MTGARCAIAGQVRGRACHLHPSQRHMRPYRGATFHTNTSLGASTSRTLDLRARPANALWSGPAKPFAAYASAPLLTGSYEIHSGLRTVA